MKKIYIIHGWEGDSRGDWIPWAKNAFEEIGHSVVVPDMPDTKHPKIVPWVMKLRMLAVEAGEESVFIGHSIGCQTIMRFLEAHDRKVGGAIFVAGWFNLINLEGIVAQGVADQWMNAPLNFEKIKSNLPKSVAVLGNNDTWVPCEETKKDFEEKLGTKVIVLDGAGHMTGDDGFGPFPKLIEIFNENFS